MFLSSLLLRIHVLYMFGIVPPQSYILDMYCSHCVLEELCADYTLFIQLRSCKVLLVHDNKCL